MFISFFLELRAAKVPASLREFLTLLEAMRAGVAGFDIDQFYFLSRAALVKDERHLDRFDRVFAHCFNGVETPADPQTALPDEWLKKLAERFDQLSFFLGQKALRNFAQPGIWYPGLRVGQGLDPLEAVPEDAVEPVEIAFVFDQRCARQVVEILDVEGRHTFLHRLRQSQIFAQRDRDFGLAQLDKKGKEHG